MNLFAMKRRIQHAILFFVMFTTGCALVNPQISHENYLKIKNGMSEQEVSAYLGEPTEVKSAGANLDLGSLFGLSVGSLMGTDSLSGSYMKWQSNTATIHIFFTGGKVRFKNYNTN